MSDLIEAIRRARIEAAAEVLCDGSGWPLKDCRYLAEKMLEAADRTHNETDKGPPLEGERGKR